MITKALTTSEESASKDAKMKSTVMTHISNTLATHQQHISNTSATH
jgi:hypothetical protein